MELPRSHEEVLGITSAEHDIDKQNFFPICKLLMVNPANNAAGKGPFWQLVG